MESDEGYSYSRRVIETVLLSDAVDQHTVSLVGESNPLVVADRVADVRDRLRQRLVRLDSRDLWRLVFDFEATSQKNHGNRTLRDRARDERPTPHWQVLDGIAQIVRPHDVDIHNEVTRLLDIASGAQPPPIVGLFGGSSGIPVQALQAPPLHRLAELARQQSQALEELCTLGALSAKAVAEEQDNLRGQLGRVAREALREANPEQAHELMDKIEQVLDAFGFSRGDLDLIVVGLAKTLGIAEITAAARERHRGRR